ncbi:hypothetical protein EON65_11310 [archaeon]|nr:MAG: hypothetical protein EON65_11310 [archaeon]
MSKLLKKLIYLILPFFAHLWPSSPTQILNPNSQNLGLAVKMAIKQTFETPNLRVLEVEERVFERPLGCHHRSIT